MDEMSAYLLASLLETPNGSFDNEPRCVAAVEVVVVVVAYASSWEAVSEPSTSEDELDRATRTSSASTSSPVHPSITHAYRPLLPSIPPFSCVSPSLVVSSHQNRHRLSLNRAPEGASPPSLGSIGVGVGAGVGGNSDGTVGIGIVGNVVAVAAVIGNIDGGDGNGAVVDDVCVELTRWGVGCVSLKRLAVHVRPVELMFHTEPELVLVLVSMLVLVLVCVFVLVLRSTVSR